MVIIETPAITGINPFYPLLTGRKGTIRLVDLKRYRRYLRASLLIGLLLCIAGLALLEPTIYTDARFTLFSFGNLLFATARTRKMSRVAKIETYVVLSFKRTSVIADLEFATTFFALGLGCLIVGATQMPEYSGIALILCMACFLFALIPIFNSIAFSLFGIGNTTGKASK